MTIKDILKNILSKETIHFLSEKKANLKKSSRKTYSQCGEDIIMMNAFNEMGRKNITYVDIGTNEPKRGSNTFLFYKNGGKGICIEPNPSLFKKIKRVRKNDICLNMGITGENNRNSMIFYLLSTPVLSTFSKEQLKDCLDKGFRIDKEIIIKTIGINAFFEEYFKDTKPDLVSIDTEGLDYEIVSSLDLKRFRPTIFCIETLTFDIGVNGKKTENIINLMKNNDYFIYADTHLNTIFIDKNSYINKK